MRKLNIRKINKKSHTMKRKISLKHILALVCSTILFSSCDPGYYDELYFDNQSEYDILVEYSRSYRYSPSEYERGYDGTYPTPNGKRTLVYMDGGLGCTGTYESKYSIFNYFYGDSISFVIDSTRKITYYAYDTLSEDSPYNFNSSHYQHTYKEPTGNFGCEASESSHTYTITTEQINNRLKIL